MPVVRSDTSKTTNKAPQVDSICQDEIISALMKVIVKFSTVLSLIPACADILRDISSHKRDYLLHVNYGSSGWYELLKLEKLDCSANKLMPYGKSIKYRKGFRL